jgi:hypothetical protein
MDWAGDCKVLAVRFLFQQILAIVECDCISIEYRHLATNRKNTTIVAVSQCLLSPCLCSLRQGSSGNWRTPRPNKEPDRRLLWVQFLQNATV